MKPGTTYRSVASTTSTPSYSPRPAIQPSATAMSTSSHSRVKTERTRPPRTTTSAGSSPRATARRRARPSMQEEATTLGAVDVLTPRTLDEALRLKAETPAAVPIQGGTDLMVELNFDRARPDVLL